jgi:hypothetical protein
MGLGGPTAGIAAACLTRRQPPFLIAVELDRCDKMMYIEDGLVRGCLMFWALFDISSVAMVLATLIGLFVLAILFRVRGAR